MAQIARVAVEKAAYRFDRLYDYLVPDGMALLPGARVVVPFGGSRRIGLVVETGERQPPEGIALKVVLAPADREPVLSREGLALLCWLKENTFCTWFEALSVLLPAGYGVKSRRGYTLCRGLEQPAELSDAACAVLELLRGRRAPLDAAQLAELLELPRGRLPLRELEERGLIAGEDLVSRRTGDAATRMIRLTEQYDAAALTPKQRAAAALLETVGQASAAEVCYFSGVGKSVLDRLVAAGAAEYFEQEYYRDPYRDADRTESRERAALSPEQQRALEALWAHYREAASPALLYGVTGSGKTLVYLALIDRVLAQGRRVVVLVPEIALTPQTISRFHSAYGARVAVIHSGLSMTERLDEWKRIRAGKADVVVGTRSAVFAPVEHLGLIVVDEEQEHTYRSESAPRYDACAVARFRCAESGGMALFVSATPSVESYYRATRGGWLLVSLRQRYGAARLPDVCIVDLAAEELPAEGFSQSLCEEILYNLDHKHQTILLVNRRGYSTQVRCMRCHTPAECPNCSIPLKYHSANGRLMCHYCGYSTPAPTRCPACGSEYIRYTGMGTQKAEEILRARFPGARILRMDQDTTLRKFSHQELLAQFGRGEYDILLGTQMVAKGLDFPNVTLVGVLTVDSMLYSDDFRSYEKTFSLVTQVVGRSGRQEIAGRALLQTYTPENPVIQSAATQDYPAFYAQEIETRRYHLYPPFCRIYCIGILGEQERTVADFAGAQHRALTALLRADYPALPARVLGLAQAHIYKVAGRYRYKILLKAKSDRETRAMLHRFLAEATQAAPKGVAVYIDPNYDNDL